MFLIHFARAKALAVFKAESIEAMRDKTAAIAAILSETLMHLKYCEGWGIPEAEVRATPESAETVSYTRYVIDRGLAGDILDLEVALAPCTVGYGEVALRILADPQRRVEGNAYQSWIDTYGDPGYQAMARAAAARIDALGESHGGHARFALLSATFSEAARLEARFWQQGLDAAAGHRPPMRRSKAPDASVAMSGGVDSSVVAGLLREQGHDVIGATLQLYDHGAATARRAPAAPGRTSMMPAASPIRSTSRITCWTARAASATPWCRISPTATPAARRRSPASAATRR